MDTALKAVLKKAPKGSSEFERELYLHDQLISLVEYHDEAEDHSSEYPMAFSAYGALVDGKAVCEGYSRLCSYYRTAWACNALWSPA